MKAEDRLGHSAAYDTVGDLEPVMTKGIASEAIALLREFPGDHFRPCLDMNGQYGPCNSCLWDEERRKFLDGEP